MVVLIIFYFKIKCIHFCATHIYQSSNLLNSFRTRGEKLWCKRAHAGRALSRDRHQVKVNPPWYHINYMIGASGNKSMRPLGVGFYAWRLLMATGARGASPTRILLFRVAMLGPHPPPGTPARLRLSLSDRPPHPPPSPELLSPVCWLYLWPSWISTLGLFPSSWRIFFFKTPFKS